MLNLHIRAGEVMDSYMARRGHTLKEVRRKHEMETFDLYHHRCVFRWGGDGGGCGADGDLRPKQADISNPDL